jgi:Ca2+-binding EF-hand superfamily protein
MGPMVMMRIIFSLMDANGDGKLSLEEFQAAHERIFKAMDADHDGTVTLDEKLASAANCIAPSPGRVIDTISAPRKSHGNDC